MNGRVITRIEFTICYMVVEETFYDRNFIAFV